MSRSDEFCGDMNYKKLGKVSANITMYKKMRGKMGKRERQGNVFEVIGNYFIGVLGKYRRSKRDFLQRKWVLVP